MCSTRKKLFTSRPAPVNKIADRATSATTKTFRSRLADRLAVELLAFSLSGPAIVWLDRCKAGASPNRIPAPKDTSSANANAERVKPLSPTLVTSAGVTRMIALINQCASKSPAAALTRASSRLSVNNWRMISLRPAPRAQRIATSLRRSVARDNRSVATFAHAINRTRVTAPNIRTKLVR